jgi:hypothetical protein
MRRRWFRKSAKWTSTIAAALVVAAAVFSLFRSVGFEYISKGSKTAWGVSVRGGQLIVGATSGYNLTLLHIHEGWEIEGPEEWKWLMYEDAGPAPAWRGGLAWHAASGPISDWNAGVTLLYPFLLAALPAGLLWWADCRRSRPARCAECGYDRAGLTTAATCPECGTPPAPATV